MNSGIRPSASLFSFAHQPDAACQAQAYGLGGTTLTLDTPEGTRPTLAQLVGAVYCAVPTEVRVQMLEHLLRPLGVLSLAAVAHGAFAKICFRNGWSACKVRVDDAMAVRRADVISLVDHVLQVDERVVQDLAPMLQRLSGVRELDATRALVERLQRAQRPDQPGVMAARPVEPVWH